MNISRRSSRHFSKNVTTRNNLSRALYFSEKSIRYASFWNSHQRNSFRYSCWSSLGNSSRNSSGDFASDFFEDFSWSSPWNYSIDSPRSSVVELSQNSSRCSSKGCPKRFLQWFLCSFFLFWKHPSGILLRVLCLLWLLHSILLSRFFFKQNFQTNLRKHSRIQTLGNTSENPPETLLQIPQVLSLETPLKYLVRISFEIIFFQKLHQRYHKKFLTIFF